MKQIATVLLAAAACAAPSDLPEHARFLGTVDSSVTHVMAVSPSGSEVRRVLSPTEQGAFSVEVEPGRPWVLVFVDARRQGLKMVRGTLQVDSLDTLIPRRAGDIDLGDIAIDKRVATSQGELADLDAALGVPRDLQMIVGSLDDLALRYANPDVNSDGFLDLEQGLDARLEIQTKHRMMVGKRAATVDDLVSNPDAIELAYEGTGISVRLPEAFGDVDREDASVKFRQWFYGISLGLDRPAVPPGEEVTHLTYGDRKTFGVYARAGYDVPRGDYSFRSGKHTLDFTLVRPPTTVDATSSVRPFAVRPRIRLVSTDPGCTRACALQAVDFTWQQQVGTSWIPLTEEAVSLLQPVGAVDLVDSDGGYRHYELPRGVASGSVPAVHVIAREGGTSAAPDMNTSSIAYVKVSAELSTGLRMHAWLAGPAPVSVDLDSLVLTD